MESRTHEDMHKFGGYFIINGNEKIVRMLVVANPPSDIYLSII